MTTKPDSALDARPNEPMVVPLQCESSSPSFLPSLSLSLSLTSNQPHTVKATSTTNGILRRTDREEREIACGV